MRIAVVADIHGNLTALDAVLADMADAAVDRLVCLGDVAATGPQPHEVTARLRALDCALVMGNTDAASLRPVRLSPSDAEGRRYADIDAWCAAQLASEDLAFIRTFQPTITVPLDDAASLLCFHGSPRSSSDSIVATTPDTVLARLLAGYGATVLAGGHTHASFVRRFRQASLFNPGSVGLPYELRDTRLWRPPWAEYGIVDRHADTLAIELRRVAVDTTLVVHAALESGMPHAEWWADGWR